MDLVPDVTLLGFFFKRTMGSEYLSPVSTPVASCYHLGSLLFKGEETGITTTLKVVNEYTISRLEQ